MKNITTILVICLYTIPFQACKEKVLLENFNMNQWLSSSVKFSDFIGEHRLISIKQIDSISISSSLKILKRENHLYILSAQQCFQFDKDGGFIKKINFSHLFHNKELRPNSWDIYVIDNKIQLWIGIQKNIHCLSFDEGEESHIIPVEISFESFKRISEDTILLLTKDNYNLLAICGTNGKIKEYGLPQKAKTLIQNNYVFMRYNNIFIAQYPSTSLAAYYDLKSEKLKEILLVKEDNFVNTWQKQTELINEYGLIRGFNTASNSYSNILHLSKPQKTSIIFFKKKTNFFFSIKREEDMTFRTLQISPKEKTYFENDIISVENFGLQLRNSFSETDSDDSLLFYFSPNKKGTSKKTTSIKQKELIILEIL